MFRPPVSHSSRLRRRLDRIRVFLMRQSIQMLLLCWTSLKETEHFIGRLGIISLNIVRGNTTLEHSTRLYLSRASAVDVSLTCACKLIPLIVHCDTWSAEKFGVTTTRTKNGFNTFFITFFKLAAAIDNSLFSAAFIWIICKMVDSEDITLKK